MRDASLAVIREIGVETGGSNIQFAINPEDGRMIVIEMNPRVSRSSALASKATGFPIAKIAAKLAVGYRLHELPNDITRKTMACFEPTIDYVVTKVPRFAFEKFPEADARLTTQMKSVGETMAIGRTFKESFQKAIRGLEVGSFGFGCDGKDLWGTAQQPSREEIRARLAVPRAERVWYLRYAMKDGMSLEEIFELTGIDPWFLDELKQIVELEDELRAIHDPMQVSDELLRRAKQFGFSDRQISHLWNMSEMEVPAPNGNAAASSPRTRPDWGRPEDKPKRIRGRALQKKRRHLFHTEPRCRKCGRIFATMRDMVRDHIVPLAEGGIDDSSNQQPLCLACSDAKTQQEALRGRKHRKSNVINR